VAGRRSGFSRAKARSMRSLLVTVYAPKQDLSF